MGDLIRREELLTSQFVHTECYLQANKDRHYDVYKKGWNDALQDAYDNAPTVDAVEVVRCKDCKHAEYDHEAKYDGQKWYLCRYAWGQFNQETHFCSYGERKTDE